MAEPPVESVTESSKSVSGSPFTVAMPATRPDGDLYFAVVLRNGNATLNDPAGWIELLNTQVSSSGSAQMYVGYRLGAGGEPATYDWTHTGSTDCVGTILRISGVDVDDLIGATPTNNDGTGITSVAPTLTAEQADSLILRCHGADTDHFTIETDPTIQSRNTPTGTRAVNLAICSESSPGASTATGTHNAVLDQSDQWEALTVEIRAASAATDDLDVTDDEAAFAEGSVALTGVGTMAVGVDTAAFDEGTIDLEDGNFTEDLVVTDDEVAHAEGTIDLNAVGTLDVADDEAAHAEAGIDLNAIGTLDITDDPALFAEDAIDLDDANFTQDLDVTDDEAAFAEDGIDLNAVGSLDVTDDEAAFAEGTVGLTAIGTLAVSGVADSYGDENRDANDFMDQTTDGVAQSVTGDGGVLIGATFSIRKNSVPTGDVQAHLYAHSGSFGTSSVPTGSPLASSEIKDASTMPLFQALERFNFSDNFKMVGGTNYVLALEYEDGTFSESIHNGIDESTPTHPGNYATQNTSKVWSAVAGTDMIFFIHTSTLAFDTDGVDLNSIGILDVTDDNASFDDGVVDLTSAGTLEVTDDNVSFDDGVVNLTAIGTLIVTSDLVAFAEAVIDLDFPVAGDMDVTDNASFDDDVVDLNAVGTLDVADDEVVFAEATVNLNAIGTLVVTDDEAAFAEATVNLTAIGTLAVADPAVFAEGSIDITAVGLLRVTDDTVAFGEDVIELQDVQVELAVTSVAAFAEAVLDLTDANALVGVRRGGDPHGAWENFAYYRRKYLEREQREAPFAETVTAETTTEPLVLESTELGEAIVELNALLVEREAALEEGRQAIEKLELGIADLARAAKAKRKAELRRIRTLEAALELERTELAKAIELARELRRRISEEIAVVMAVLILFFGVNG